MNDNWSFEACLDEGSLPTGEPLECLFGTGWWTQDQEQEQPPIVQCHICGGEAWGLGNVIDCENCGEIYIGESNDPERTAK